MFRHVNGRVKVGAFQCTEEQFAVIEPAYTGLPEGVIERRYDPDAPGGKPRHVLITGDHRQTGGPAPWPEGDAILARAADYPRLLAARIPSPPPAPQPTPPREKPAAPAEPRGTTIAALRAEVAAMRRALIDAGVWKVSQ